MPCPAFCCSNEGVSTGSSQGTDEDWALHNKSALIFQPPDFSDHFLIIVLRKFWHVYLIYKGPIMFAIKKASWQCIGIVCFSINQSFIWFYSFPWINTYRIHSYMCFLSTGT